MNSSAKSLNPRDFGRKITLLRKQQGISQKDLSVKSGVPLTAVRRCEQKGQIPLERYLAMTSALGAMVDVLVSESPKGLKRKTVRKTSNQQIFHSRQEAKWQFRRKLLLTTANLLEKKSEQVWPKVSKTVSMLLKNPSTSIQKSTRRWLRFAGNNPQSMIQTIRAQFSQDTPEGPRRHKLQDLSDGHPFSGILSEATLRKLREETLERVKEPTTEVAKIARKKEQVPSKLTLPAGLNPTRKAAQILSEEQITLLQEFFVKNHAQCFWSWNPKTTVNQNNAERILKTAKTYGGSDGYKLAQQLSKQTSALNPKA